MPLFCCYSEGFPARKRLFLLRKGKRTRYEKVNWDEERDEKR